MANLIEPPPRPWIADLRAKPWHWAAALGVVPLLDTLGAVVGSLFATELPLQNPPWSVFMRYGHWQGWLVAGLGGSVAAFFLARWQQQDRLLHFLQLQQAEHVAELGLPAPAKAAVAKLAPPPAGAQAGLPWSSQADLTKTDVVNAHYAIQLQLALEGSASAAWSLDVSATAAVDAMGRVPPGQLQCAGAERLMRYSGSNFSQDFVPMHRLHAEDFDRFKKALHALRVAGTALREEVRFLCFDGEYRWFLVRGQRSPVFAGGQTRLSGIVTDLTEQHRAEEMRRLTDTMENNTSEGVVVTDAKSRILSVNAAFTQLLGYTEAELLGKTPREFKSGRHDKAFYEAMWAEIHQTGQWRGEIWNRRKNGEIFPENMSLSSVRNAQGEVTHYVCMFSDISEEKASQHRLEELSQNDVLTGLPNRQEWSQQLETMLEEAQASGESLAVLQLYLARFKDVNDSYGYATGDLLLQHIARSLREVPHGGLLGRSAGDGFALVVRSVGDACVEKVAQAVIDAVRAPWRSPDGMQVVVNATVGICLYPQHASTAADLMQGAHAAAHGEQDTPGDSTAPWRFFDPGMTSAARERLEIEARLRVALAEGHMRLYYQPKVDIASGRIVGAEALVRWLDPVEGIISPARFIPVAESSGMVVGLGQWVLEEACRQGQIWRQAGLPELLLAVNVSPRQFQLGNFAELTAQVLAQSGFPPALLELEITETALTERPELALRVLQQLRALGTSLSIDDFGTGQSSLARLKRFPIDVLKIDQSFIREIPESADDMVISSAIIALGHSLGFKVIAEGVETEAQLAFLRQRKCDQYQGYLCSRPVPPHEFELLLKAQTAQEVATMQSPLIP